MGREGPALILYLDTSALVKLYVTEAGSAALRQRVRGAGLSTYPVRFGSAR